MAALQLIYSEKQCLEIKRRGEQRLQPLLSDSWYAAVEYQDKIFVLKSGKLSSLPIHLWPDFSLWGKKLTWLLWTEMLKVFFLYMNGCMSSAAKPNEAHRSSLQPWTAPQDRGPASCHYKELQHSTHRWLCCDAAFQAAELLTLVGQSVNKITWQL